MIENIQLSYIWCNKSYFQSHNKDTFSIQTRIKKRFSTTKNIFQSTSEVIPHEGECIIALLHY